MSLTCTSEDSSAVEWLYNGEVISDATRNTYMVQDLTESNSGYYQCRIGGQTADSIISSSYVHTAAASVSGEDCALLGSQHELECTFAYPTREREFRWLRNGQPVPLDGRRAVETNRSGSVSVSRLIIDRVEDEDNGTYVCEVRVFGTDDILTDTFQLITVGEFATCAPLQHTSLVTPEPLVQILSYLLQSVLCVLVGVCGCG